MSITRTRTLALPFILAAGAALSGCTPSAEAKPESAASPSADHASEEQASDEHAEWSYTGDTGPEAWGEVAEQCTDTSDSEQSPIDLDAPAEETKGTEKADGASASAPVFDYRPTAMNVVNNGHAIQADPTDPDAEGAEANTLTLDGTEYTLAQFHLHALSEHTVEGDHADMELHLVHEDADGGLAVVAVFLDQGAENPTLDPVFTSMPSEVTAEEDAGEPLAEPLDLGALVPEDSAASRYDGSLTTPPCSEGVEWIVMDEAQTVSKEQLERFRDLYPANNRPVQQLHDREVTTVVP